MTNISVSTPGGVTLATYGGGPSFTITNGTAVAYTASTSGYGAVYGDNTAAWTITNDGTVTGSANANGILLGGGLGSTGFQNTIINQGTISGGNYGVRVYNSASSVTYIENVANYTIQGGQGAIFMAGPGSVTNHGTIISTAGYGVQLSDGGSIFNDGTIQGVNDGVYLDGSAADAVTNAGLITASGTSYVVTLAQGGSIDNTGTIEGHSGVTLDGAGTVTNEGSISANAGYGIKLGTGDVVANTGTIQGAGGIYVAIGAASTITNSGLINGGLSNDAVHFASGNASSKLIVDPTASFVGGIYGGGGTIELADGGASSLAGFGASITNFGTLQFDPTAAWTVSDSGSGFGTMAIAGFYGSINSTIELTGFVASSETYATNAMTLGNGSSFETLDIQGVVLSTPSGFQVTSNAGNTYIVDCFAACTNIATPGGLVRVEDLAIGDLVNTHFAGAVAIEWIGHRHLDCTRHPDPRKVWPVRMAAGTLGPARPIRDLTLSPNHAVYVNGELIPIGRLINGTSIVQIPVDEVTYYHVELAEHDLLLAEGVLAESYLDVGDRSNFGNAGDEVRLFPDFANCPPDVAATWEIRGCAPLLLCGPRLEKARDWISALTEETPLAAAA
jgi:collagen type I alpha